MQFLPSSGSCRYCYMEAPHGRWLNGEKAWRQLHKNVASNIEHVMETALRKAAAIRTPTTHHKNYQNRRTRHVGHCWESRDELVSDVLLWTLSHGRAKAGRPARTYIQQLCAHTGCSPEHLPKAMDDREVWRERVRNIRADSATYMMIYIQSLEQAVRRRGSKMENGLLDECK